MSGYRVPYSNPFGRLGTLEVRLKQAEQALNDQIQINMGLVQVIKDLENQLKDAYQRIQQLEGDSDGHRQSDPPAL